MIEILIETCRKLHLIFMTFQGCVGTPLPGTEVRIVTQNMEGDSEVLLR